MKRIKLKLKLIGLLLLVTLLPATLNAQNDGGMLGYGHASGNAEYSNREGLFDPGGGGYNLHNQQFGSDITGGYELHNQTFGQDAPLGSGWLVLMLAGAAYALKKRKNNNKKQLS